MSTFYHTRPLLDCLEAIHEQEYAGSNHLDRLLDIGFTGLRKILKRISRKDVALAVRFRDNLYSAYLYHLTNEGEALLRAYRTPKSYVKLYRPREDFRIEFRHKIGIANTIANLRAGCKETPCRFVSQSEIEEENGLDPTRPLKLPASVSTTIQGQLLSWKGDIEPDGLFAVEYPDGKRSYIALEYQRTGKVRANTLYGVSSMRRKLLAYADIEAQKAYKQWGISNLRVLFVFTKLEDYTASVKLAEELFPNGSPMFLFVYQREYDETATGLMIAPQPNPGLFTTPLTRAGREPIAIYDAEKDPALSAG